MEDVYSNFKILPLENVSVQYDKQLYKGMLATGLLVVAVAVLILGIAMGNPLIIGIGVTATIFSLCLRKVSIKSAESIAKNEHGLIKWAEQRIPNQNWTEGGNCLFPKRPILSWTEFRKHSHVE